MRLSHPRRYRSRDKARRLQIRSDEICGRDRCVCASRSVEDREPPRKVAVSFGPAFPADTRDQDLAARRVRIAEKLNHFSDVVDKRHGIGICELVWATQLRLDVRRGQLENLDRAAAKLKAQRLQPRVQK